ncbi:Nuclear polyadenylated RNA-binding protein NAB2 [Cytospora mali]|uniref:Nuclear polyadenylated RNA-binding protein NAB2 n=1 Tax=Cytospora mali TaxID=578113 RepID=A0A194UQQ5_CYTMA|nr:Nuclear polyadenylated RNA-binding protein NAB2 [Valsa mali var. pyri (nom. inval.)]
MPVAVELNTPLADALNSAIQPKLEEYGWATGGADDAALTEYIILMLVNGKTQEEVTGELSADLLGLDPNDPGLLEFSTWLFATIDILAAQFGATNAQTDATTSYAQGESAAADADQDMEMGTASDGPGGLNVPTGPKAMRNGADRGRGKRLVGQLNRAMDRTHESALHRVRGGSGNERINSHGRTPPTGPRMGAGRLPRAPNQRAASIAHGLANMGGMPPGAPGMNGGAMGPMNGWGMMPGQPPQMDVMHMLEAQQQMLNQMQQQLIMSQGGSMNNGFNGQGRGKSLFDRAQHPNQRGNFRGRGGHHQNGRNNQQQSTTPKNESTEQGDDAEMAGVQRESVNPEESVCKYNLHCTNKECKFAHQSPAAPPGATVDINDVCSFGAACKNFKCVGRHPSPATKTAHQNEQDCKFWPNCQNPRCPFKHPSKPPCRNGADCKTVGCEFYHNTVMCKFRPCTNRYCQFKHEDGQRGTFPDKVWTADKANEHVSERKFADDKVDEEQVIPGAGDDAMGGTEQTTVAG